MELCLKSGTHEEAPYEVIRQGIGRKILLRIFGTATILNMKSQTTGAGDRGCRNLGLSF